MWPTDSLWANASLFAALASALVLAAGIASVVHRSTAGHKLLQLAPLFLGAAIAAIVASAWLAVTDGTPLNSCTDAASRSGGRPLGGPSSAC
jgi:hypothetical protein